MPGYAGTFKCAVMSARSLVFENEIKSLFITGDRGEYEILPYHYPVLGIVKPGHIVIDWKTTIPTRGGVLRFFANECIIMVEEELNNPKDKEHK